MIQLGVNVDHVATLRQARLGKYPDPVTAALLCELAGANNITCHLREDRRHIQDRDVKLLKQMLHIPLNLEMAACQEMLQIALDIKPSWVTFVPEKREELTTEGGLDLVIYGDSLSKAIHLLQEAGIRVSLFIDPTLEAVKLSHRIGVKAIELHTGKYSDAGSSLDTHQEFTRIQEAVLLATKLRLIVHAGHGLNYHNVQSIVGIPGIESLQIGHSIVSHSVWVGLDQAVREMKSLMNPSLPFK
jgi:pyridoxine 5-phosphate synthase